MGRFYSKSLGRIPPPIGRGTKNLLEDSYKNIWVGYFEGSGYPYHGGLSKFDGLNWTIYTSLNSGLYYNGITSLLEDSPGKILVGMQYLGGHGPALVEYDGQSWFELPNTSPNLSNTCMIRYAKGILYVDTSNDGVNTFDGQNWSSIKLSSLPNPNLCDIIFRIIESLKLFCSIILKANLLTNSATFQATIVPGNHTIQSPAFMFCNLNTRMIILHIIKLFT